MANNDGRRDDGYSVRRWLEVVSRLLESELSEPHVCTVHVMYIYNIIYIYTVYEILDTYDYVIMIYYVLLNITILAYI